MPLIDPADSPNDDRPDFIAGWWFTVDQLCVEVAITPETWEDWRALGHTPDQVTGPDGVDRVHAADWNAWFDWAISVAWFDWAPGFTSDDD